MKYGKRPLEAALNSRIHQIHASQAHRQPLLVSNKTYLSIRHRSTSASSTGDRPVTPAFIFDIDGVLKVGEKVLPQGKKALQVLSGDNKLGRRFPFILVTNGGGITEEKRCQRLTRELGVEISTAQLIQAHTVFREQAQNYGNKPILVVGGNGNACREVAESYGFTQAYIPQDLLAWRPELWPFRKICVRESAYVKVGYEFSEIPFAAVFVFHDSRDWGFDTQIMTDVLASPNGIVGSWRDMEAEWDQQIPVFFSNPDLLWGNDWSEPRFGQGAFQEAFRAIWKRTTGRELKATTGGKPTKLTYQHAEKMLLAQANHPEILPPGGHQLEKLGCTFMLGDNPYSDIQGANAYGISSILVRTGVFRGKDNHHEHPATSVQADVLDGVRWALQQELGEDIIG